MKPDTNESPAGSACLTQPVRLLAESIADALMTNGAGVVATRLEMKQALTNRLGGPERPLGGWCRAAVIREILAVLQPTLAKAIAAALFSSGDGRPPASRPELSIKLS